MVSDDGSNKSRRLDPTITATHGIPLEDYAETSN